VTQPFVLALSQLPEPPFRRVLLKSLLLTALAYVGCGLLAWYGFGWIPGEGWAWVPWDWLATAFKWLAGSAIFFLSVVLFPAIATLFVSLFLDEIARAVDARHFADDAPGRDTPLSDSMMLALRFMGALILLNLVVLPFYLLLWWIPFVPVIIFYGSNGYLLGREYFELVAQRHSSIENVPLFATAWMAHVFKRLEKKAQTDFAGAG
jgi:uncharacterized protein involved in cysteine biosynthesis